MFFPFQLALPKAAYFCFANTTAIFLLCGSLHRFAFCILPFAIWGILLFVLGKFTRFFILCCFIRCLFVAVYAFSQSLFVSTAVFLPFLYCFFPLPFFPLLLEHFALCPFQFYKQSFARCPLLPLFVLLCVGFTFCVTFDGNLLQKFVTRQKV